MSRLHEQLAAINQNYNNWGGVVKFRKYLVLKGKVRPSVISPEYEIKIVYQENAMPEVYVVSPDLKIREGKNSLPHVYRDDKLCLYYKDFDKKTDLLADSIIVWITWWLYYYEIWFQTGKWVAKGTHPERW